MATTVQHDDIESEVRPDRPQHARAEGDVVDVRDDSSRPYVAPARVERAEPVEPVRRGLRARRVLGWVLAAAALAVVAVVAIANRSGEMGIDLAVDDGTLPIWSVIAGAAALGFVAGRFLDDGC